ncbi:hypothetical protein [Defluviimonas salinarum]|uniref:Uncharacterized protein n=1 Tax=Defluviimonas salinarum TaxID=2992147 RepID=A0ABT3J4U0_9RHOB|nr:hypothetical protein [Defluviimonas salinarum]MCW3782485.1 hypothetical protein [Defluviimonas salinarum]
MKKGWMQFMSEAPMIGLRPHPGSAPDADGPAEMTAEAWFRVYNCHETREAALASANDDHETILDAYREGNMEVDLDDLEEGETEEDRILAEAGDPDEVWEVEVHDNGDLVVYDGGSAEFAVRLTAEDIYRKGFGMPLPAILAGDTPAP